MVRNSSFLVHRSSFLAALVLILLLSFALRVYRLGAQSLWYDEAVTAQVTQQGLGELARWTADDIQPPLYYTVVSGWTQLAGASEWALRYPSAWFGVAMVALAYALGRRLFGRPAGLLAALLAAVHPLWLYYSQEARMYTLLTALGMAAGYTLLRVLDAALTPPPGPVRSPPVKGLPSKERGRKEGESKGMDVGDSAASPLPLPLSFQGRGPGGGVLCWTAFVALSAAMLYTHYFAAFLLLAFGVFFLIVLLAAARRGLAVRRLLLEGIVAAAAVVLLYLPWLPNALRRFQVDASYWQGTLKLDEALRHLAISYSTGETALEAIATPLAWAGAALTGLCLLALVWTSFKRPTPVGPRGSTGSGLASCPLPLATLFAVLYVAVPVGAILLLSYGNPKFNPRYLMLASPGLILLLAGGLALPFRPVAPRGAVAGRQGSHKRLARGLALAALAGLLAVYLYAGRNWFADPAFTKDDWRGAVAYVRSQLAPDEGVVLVSGHALPAWRYYAPDVEPVRLPALETLDVNAVLDLDAAGLALDAGLAGKAGAWLVQWQDEVVDPNGVVPFLLGSAGQPTPSGASFWGLGQPRHYRWPAGASFAGQPADVHPVNANFGNQIELLGYSQPPCSPNEAENACPLYLFWRALAPISADYKLSATLADDADHTWSRQNDRRLAAYDYPTFRWPAGSTILSKVALTPDLGTPPGEYRLRLAVYDAASGQALNVLDSAGAPQGQAAWLAPVRLDHLATPGPSDLPSDLPSPPRGGAGGEVPGGEVPGGEVDSLSAIQLLHAAVDPAAAEAGQRLLAQLWWRATQPPAADYTLRWQWIDPNGIAGDAGSAAPGGASFPAHEWPAGALVRSQVDVRVPTAAQQTPGQWRLRLGLADPDNPAAFGNETIELPVQVKATQRSFEPPPLQFPTKTRFGEQIELLGIDLAAGAVLPGATVPVTVAWQALAEMDTSFTGFVHLLDAAGTVVAQDDHLPRQGEHPTNTWLPGEVVADRYTLALPADLPPGDYRMEIGLYNAGLPRLPRPGAPAIVGPVIVASN